MSNPLRSPGRVSRYTGPQQTKEPKQIASRLVAMQCSGDWEAINNQYGPTRTLWILLHHFTAREQIVLIEIASGKLEQGRLDLSLKLPP